MAGKRVGKLEVVDEEAALEKVAGMAQEAEAVENALRPGDMEWSDYVLSKLQAKEIDPKGHPKVAGLRRLVVKLIGPIVRSVPQILQTPIPENERRCTVVYHISVMDRFSGELLEVAGAADSYHGNTDVKFRVHPSAMAETRAEGRALKKILMLDAVTSEELAPENAETIPSDSDDFINDTQKNGLSMLGSKLDINIGEAFQLVLGKPYNKMVSSTNARKVIERVSSYQKDISTIPLEIKGYVADWS